MNHLRFKFLVGMVVLFILTSALIAIINYIHLKEQTKEENALILNRIEQTIIDSIETYEKAIQLLDTNTATTMQKNTEKIIALYKENPNFDEWDFQKLFHELGMHIYIINEENVITHSSYQKDIGLDFRQCCQKLASILDERRKSGEFYHDAMDIEQQTGDVKKFSYMATPDKKYIIELSYNLNDNKVFNAFNFFHTIEELKSLYPYIHDINVLNFGGLALGTPISERRLTDKEREAFEKTLKSKKTEEITGDWKGKQATFRYIYYDSIFNEDQTQNKIVEIIYDKKLWSANLDEYRKMFVIQILIIISFILVLSFAVARPMYLAYHDRLTGLANRSAYEDLLSSVKAKNGMKTAFLMIDLDYFKEVNDELGHQEGDIVLKQVAEIIRSAIPKNALAYRYGGDEFVVILNSITIEETEKVACNIIAKINDFVEQNEDVKNLGVSASIGISFCPDNGNNKNLLYEKADVALYEAKKKGKGQYAIFQNNQSS
ncbi:GGDEF domain-containing protein [Ureibacillus thermophilus]|uniref:GGDEF domain-containing protein n=1 Tax=Ureibacillus thermophilus TaxID=367743 RepID=A0A4P6UPC2_9BACL|nr:GGDEF domain-containing protein [Ureibacillus thermophilus]QBK25069.1 GGDEF domain-containing protein [Ureibacillus thermophilus]